MTEQFTVGTICEYQNLTGPYAHVNGMECEVIAPLEERYAVDAKGRFGYGPMYIVREAMGDWAIEARYLRRKPPKATDTGEMRIKELFDKSPVVQPEPEFA